MPTLVGAASRPKEGELVCGDLSVVVPFSQGLLLCLADGLGHGEQALVSAEAACLYAREHAEEPLESLLRGLDRALAGLRGAAVSVLVLHTVTGRAQFAGVGNVELRSVSRAHIAPPTASGIVGRGLRSVRVWSYALSAGDLFVLASDGISTRYALPELEHLAPQALADELVAKHRKSHDDASCVVARVGAP